jgi:Cu-Zn family superoxide dismutase
MKRLLTMCAGLLALTAGCAPAGDPMAGQAGRGAEAAPSVRADVRNVLGESKATVVASQLADTIRVRLEVTGMPRGTYAAHVHAVGACNPPDFTSAGPHWNPTGSQHGKNNPAGMHKGDLPNLTIGADGRGSMEYAIPASVITGGANPLMDADGAAVVIHAQADDYRTDPAGNAGARIACGVLR